MKKFINYLKQIREQKKLTKTQLYLAFSGILLFLTVLITIPYVNYQFNKNQIASIFATTNLFNDGFESSLSWTKSGSVTWYTGIPKNGTHSVQLRQTGNITKTIPLTGFNSITVAFSMGANSLDNNNENVQALYYNGASWVVLTQINNGSANENNRLNPYSINLPSTVDNLSSFALQFKINGSANNDYAYIDDVSVTGTSSQPTIPPTPTPIASPTPSLIPTPTKTNSPTPTSTQRNTPGDGVGVYYWGYPPSVDSFGQWLDNTITVSGDFMGGLNGWYDYVQMNGLATSLANWTAWEKAQPGRRMVTVGTYPWPYSIGANYSTCATGAYNTYYRQMAQNILASGIERIDLRLAWEFDGSWTGWYYPNGDYANFVGCWQQIVNSVHSIDSSHIITFDWNPTAGCCNYLDERYWPGDAYVDYVGMDLYDVQPNSATQAILTDVAAFAKKHGKKISFPEWGIWPAGNNNGNGDDPNYIQIMYDFCSNPANNVSWQEYFNTATDVDHQLDGATNYPRSSALYKQLFTSPYYQPVGF